MGSVIHVYIHNIYIYVYIYIKWDVALYFIALQLLVYMQCGIYILIILWCMYKVVYTLFSSINNIILL